MALSEPVAKTSVSLNSSHSARFSHPRVTSLASECSIESTTLRDVMFVA